MYNASATLLRKQEKAQNKKTASTVLLKTRREIELQREMELNGPK
jgi:hypothetical protein